MLFFVYVCGRECGRRKLGKISVLRRTPKSLSLERQIKIFQFLGYTFSVHQITSVLDQIHCKLQNNFKMTVIAVRMIQRKSLYMLFNPSK